MRIWLLILLSVLTACSSTDESLLPMELEEFTPSVRVQKIWSTSIGAGQDARYTQLTPVIVDDTIYAVDVKGRFFAVDKNTGKTKWKIKLDVPVSAGVAANGKTLLIGTYDAEVIALNAEDGTEKWRSSVSSEVLAKPATNGRIVAVQTFDGKLTGLDFDTGEQRWVYETTPPVLTLRGDSSPLVYGATVYAGFATGKIVALQASDGITVWEQRVAIPKGRGEFEKMIDVDGSPILVGEILLAASYQGQITAIARATGRPMWTEEVSTYNNLVADDGVVFVTDAESAVIAYRIGNGQKAWENRQLLRRALNAPQPVGEYIAVADNEDGYLHLLKKSDGVLAGRTKVDGAGVRSPMISESDILYVLSNDGKLVAYQIAAAN